MARESLIAKKGRAEAVIKKLVELYPAAHCALAHRNAFELLLATVLSAQCTDERVNMVTPELFARFPDPKTLAAAKVSEVEKIIFSTGFYRNKAKNIIGLAQALQNHHGGQVPKDMALLTQLPGVGRKTANVVLGNAFQIPIGIVVDTHVGRLARRLGLSNQKTPEAVEEDLMKLVCQEHWIQLPHWLIFHGRQVCQARRPACEQCALRPLCPQNFK